MDPITTLYERLNLTKGATAPPPPEPPGLEDWLRYWNDDDSDLGNLRNFQHWLSRVRPAPRA